jgi:small subunit ribosomal protein S4
MGKYIGIKGKICRRFGVNLFGNLKYDRLLEKRPSAPGMHGAASARKKDSEYGRQLKEKQKLKIMYGLREKQFRITFARAAQKKGITGDNLLQLLERRLDNVVFRLGFAPTRSAARQLVSHGHFKINGRKVNIPSYVVTESDEISIKDRDSSKALIQRNLELSSRRDVPQWLILTKEELKGLVARMPLRDEMPSVADELMIVELYSK